MCHVPPPLSPFANNNMATPNQQFNVTPQQIVQEIQRLGQGMGFMARDVLNSRQRIYGLEAREKLRDAARKPRSGMSVTFRSQFGEDLIIWDILGGQLDGFYIEVGAFDGYQLSVSYAFDAMGWEGLLIEPLASRFTECKKNRPHAHCVQAALAKRGSTGTMNFTEVLGDGINGMFSYLSTTPEHYQMLQQAGSKTVTTPVPVTWMDKLLEEHPKKPQRVDAAIIDVEGGEIDVLEGFDLEKYKPRVLLLEDNARGADPKLEAWMTKNAPAYQFVTWLEVNRVYVRKDDQQIMRRIAGLPE